MGEGRTSPTSEMLGKADEFRENQALRYAALFFTAGLLIHSADHWRRGFHVVTPEVYWAGTVVSILGVIAIALVLLRHRLASLVAVAVGFSTALSVAASHLLPHWSSYSDAFPGSKVDALSYAAVLVEIISALVLGLAGAYALRRARQRRTAQGLREAEQRVGGDGEPNPRRWRHQDRR